MMIKTNKREMERLYLGKNIRLIAMDDPQAIPAGTIGRCKYVDDLGQLHMAWPSGSSLALIPGVDEFELADT